VRDAVRRKKEAIAEAKARKAQEKRDAIRRKQEAIAEAKAQRERERQAAIARKREAIERAERERREAIENERARVEIARRKAEYERQRAAYLKRQQEQLAARKDRVVAAVGGEKAQRGPRSQLEAELVGIAPQGSEPGKTPQRGAQAKAKPAKTADVKAGSKVAANSSANGLDLVDELIAEPAAKPAKRR
jgi:hypothetical protein